MWGGFRESQVAPHLSQGSRKQRQVAIPVAPDRPGCWPGRSHQPSCETSEPQHPLHQLRSWRSWCWTWLEVKSRQRRIALKEKQTRSRKTWTFKFRFYQLAIDLQYVIFFLCALICTCPALAQMFRMGVGQMDVLWRGTEFHTAAKG